MTTTYSNSASATPASDWKSMLAEPFLIAGVSAFWLVTLPFAAVALVGAKAYEGVVGFSRGSSRPNPLILRKGNAASAEVSAAPGATKEA